MRWWCSASDANWTWAWRPYVGAWLMMAIIIGLLVRAGAGSRTVPIRRRISLGLGLFLLLATTDWPLAALGAGYLVSAQMVRQVLIVLIAAPMMLFGAPEALGRWLDDTAGRRRVIRVLTNPLFALIVADGLLIAVNAPPITDKLMASQGGSFVLDLAWITSGFLMWLPVQPPAPMKPRLEGPQVVVYLIGVSVAPLPIAFFMTWADFPIYSIFELAPRVFSGFDAKSDQELAAAIFQVIGGLVIWAQIVVRFVRMADGRSAPKFRGTLVESSD